MNVENRKLFEVTGFKIKVLKKIKVRIATSLNQNLFFMISYQSLIDINHIIAFDAPLNN